MSIRVPALLLLGVVTAGCTSQRGDERAAADSTVLDTLAASGGTMPSLFDITWNLTELRGQTPPPSADGSPATLRLESAEQRASGFAGCNRLFGPYRQVGDSLSFGPMGMTRKACAEGMELEQLYASALAGVTTFRLSAAGLELLGDSGTVARFSAVPPGE